MWITRRTALSIIAAAMLAVSGSAQAAPDWTPPQPVGASDWSSASVGFAADGTEIVAHADVLSQSPIDSGLRVSSRKAGTGFVDELTVNDSGGEPANATLAVAPSGAAVVTWWELVDADKYPDTPYRYRAAYRSPDGSWSEPITLAAPFPYGTAESAVIAAAIAPDGTAAAGAVVDELSAWGEMQPDTNVLVAIHPPGGAWSSPERLSPYNASADDLQLGFDDNANLTAAWSERYDEGATSSANDDKRRIVTMRRGASNGIWGSPEDLTSSSGDAAPLELGVGPDGHAVIAWEWDAPDNTLDTWAVTRPSAGAAWSTPKRIAADISAGPMAAGVAPDGTSIVMYWNQAQQSQDSGVGVVRMPSGGTWGSPKPLQKNVAWRYAEVAFLGNEAVLVWQVLDANTNKFLMSASRWAPGAADPEAPRLLAPPDTASVLRQAVNDRHGSVVASWAYPKLQIAVLDGGGPALAGANVPDTAMAGQAFDASVTFADMWSPLGDEPKWDFGDGSAPVSNASASHTYAQPGTYTITASAHDTLGNATTKTFTIRVDAPNITSAPAPAAGSQPGAPDAVKPIVTITKPRCRPHESKRACARRRGTRAAWRVIGGTVRDAAPSSGVAKVEVALTLLEKGRATAPVRFRKATVKGTTWSRKSGRLKRGSYVIRVRAFDAAGNVSRVVEQKVRLR